MNISPGLDSYGCCPYDRGVPCLYKSDTGSSSEKHGCCPRGHRCQQGACSYDEGGVTLSYAPAALLPPLRRSLRSSSCSPKETVSAKDHTTCPCWQQLLPHARVPGGNVLLLPVEYGQVCCPDGSCCAAGYRCEPRWGICTPTLAGSALNAPWIECPDGTYCHRNSTCCFAHSSSSARSSASLQYACCPHEHAQCCDDGEHCCPRGTQCEHFDQSKGHMCHSLNEEPGQTVLASKKYPSLKSVPGATYPSVPCPTWMVCSSGSCCRNEYGAYRCSPYAGGVCCASGISGCPPNTECVD
ncbi:hypothetical protein HPB52_025569 [Rhipicephalus sanguineus]|uniref:Granulins domain-containing protein n=1 Tax=Rhipicephalus sanguineus TaxID=34632 RepID=A0A9D4TCX3_RHISA|nr:hypothetical protein HPB52_025569 [Rhipicephalus sanguineus]